MLYCAVKKHIYWQSRVLTCAKKNIFIHFCSKSFYGPMVLDWSIRICYCVTNLVGDFSSQLWVRTKLTDFGPFLGHPNSWLLREISCPVSLLKQRGWLRDPALQTSSVWKKCYICSTEEYKQSNSFKQNILQSLIVFLNRASYYVRKKSDGAIDQKPTNFGARPT